MNEATANSTEHRLAKEGIGPRRQPITQLELVWQRGYHGHPLWIVPNRIGRIRWKNVNGKNVYLYEAAS
jgi:hypothetical protein